MAAPRHSICLTFAFYDLDRINEAVRDGEEGRVIKPVVRMPA